MTAGLLRGDRSRFQLFGDTVNTAARMETYVQDFCSIRFDWRYAPDLFFFNSTGVAGKIHCSQTTAEYLIRSGKEHWLEARQDMVASKGKVSAK